MRDLRIHEAYRLRHAEIQIYGTSGDSTCGVFQMPSKIDGKPMNIVASSGEGWDHVSVSRPNRCPNWPEMDYVKRMFFLDGETVMQLHVTLSDHVNMHPYTLHLWRPQKDEIPRPPGWMVGAKTKEEVPELLKQMRGE